jgi:hypothetical protein
MGAMIYGYRFIAHKVEAVRWRSDLSISDMPNWLWAALRPSKDDRPVKQVGRRLHVNTPKGLAIAEEGDWLVRNQRRELEVYKPEHFDRTFERDERPDRRTRLRSWKTDTEGRGT